MGGLVAIKTPLSEVFILFDGRKGFHMQGIEFWHA